MGKYDCIIETGNGGIWDDPEFLDTLACGKCHGRIEKFREVFTTDGGKIKDTFLVCDDCYESKYKLEDREEEIRFIIRQYKGENGGLEYRAIRISMEQAENCVQHTIQKIEKYMKWESVTTEVYDSGRCIRVLVRNLKEDTSKTHCYFTITKEIRCVMRK